MCKDEGGFRQGKHGRGFVPSRGLRKLLAEGAPQAVLVTLSALNTKHMVDSDVCSVAEAFQVLIASPKGASEKHL